MKRAAGATAAGLLLLYSIVACSAATTASSLTELSKERLVFQTQYGDIHMAFYSSVSAEAWEQDSASVELRRELFHTQLDCLSAACVSALH